MASQLFYKMVTEMTSASSDQEHVKMIMLSDTEMPDRTQAILSGNTQAVYNKMLADATLLEKCGSDAIAVTCNTAHYFIDMFRDSLTVPVIHMIEETIDELMPYKGQSVGILATDGTIKTKLYQKSLSAHGITPYILSAENQKNVMYEIYDCIKKGLPYDKVIWEEIESELHEGGCKKAILACTELSVINNDQPLGDFYIDPLEVLARKAILFSGHKIK